MVGNFPVWSENDLSMAVVGINIVQILWLRDSERGVIPRGTVAGAGIGACVERRFLASWSWWPRAVAMLLGRCFAIIMVVKPGKLNRSLLQMAQRRVEVAGIRIVV